jgi:arylsulfatase A-like enzyme
MADRLKALGYATCAIGKWHLGGPPDYLPMKRGFDEFYGTVANTPFFTLLLRRFARLGRGEGGQGPQLLHHKDEKRRTFAAMMSAMDDAVGRVMARVRERGQEENTLVFFFSDNGGPTANTTSKNDPLRGFKATTLEGGIRIPFCFPWKGTVPAGKVYDEPII